MLSRRTEVLCGQIKPHGAVYSMMARDIALARAVVGVAKLYSVPFMGLAGTCHQTATQDSRARRAVRRGLVVPLRSVNV